jgi:hypothetical protein
MAIWEAVNGQGNFYGEGRALRNAVSICRGQYLRGMTCWRFTSEVAMVGIEARAGEGTLSNRDNVLEVCNFILFQRPLFLSEGSAADVVVA